MKTKSLIFFSVFAILLTSCSMVKSPQSANFNRVKYNSHLNLAKHQNNKKLPKTIESFESETDLSVKESESLEKVSLKKEKDQTLTASIESVKAEEKNTPLKRIRTEEVNVPESRSSKRSKGLFLQKNNDKIGTINSYLNEPVLTPTANSDTALGNLLYIILVVLLILIVLSLIAELAGGLIGLLIAILLILLILRLLGIA